MIINHNSGKHSFKTTKVFNYPKLVCNYLSYFEFVFTPFVFIKVLFFLTWLYLDKLCANISDNFGFQSKQTILL